MFYRFLLIAVALLGAEPVLALDCGGEAQPCEVASGAYHIAVPAGWQGGPAVMHLHGYGGSGAKVIRNKSFVEEPLSLDDFKRIPADATFATLSQLRPASLLDFVDRFGAGASAGALGMLHGMTTFVCCNCC